MARISGKEVVRIFGTRKEHDDAVCVPVPSTERAVAKTARWVLQHERAVVVEDEVRLPREGPDGYASSLSKMKVRDGPDA